MQDFLFHTNKRHNSVIKMQLSNKCPKRYRFIPTAHQDQFVLSAFHNTLGANSVLLIYLYLSDFVLCKYITYILTYLLI